ncbi:fasciclin domain-containing protein [Octadecabacter sp. 1_MG-2023]|uniref:fasciclin domain-containing protein n=1 Tax=unclassified Octadecabacter TaxID=196158 RepID=UPI001C0A5C52|nr:MULTISPECIES: fasciclin domain-containing protein [unclassified Octadecabacter]MBU2992955.1 fasciclin domain-containing protein [Octadecabacter sp. B2R22]MDO6733594.1 fasciclin domain-containing protein [Octadecabacter sp. 1_MG-2023]
MTLKTFATAAALAVTASMSFADGHAANPMVGGAEMLAEKNIIENAVNSPIHTTLVAAVQAAGLVDTLSGDGPFTVFAPTDDAFGMIAEGTLAALLLPENKDQLTQILTCHVVGAEVFSDAIGGMIADDGGMHPVATLGGCTLMAQMNGDMITLTDENDRTATVTIADVDQSNGVIHVIDRVMLPQQ